MTRCVVTGNGAAAWGARLAGVHTIPTFPIIPQPEIIDMLAQWIGQNEMPGKMPTLESEQAMITAAGKSASSGMRVFAAISSQGLLYAMKMLYNVAGWRAPLVLVNYSSNMPTPTTLEPERHDVLAACDSGFLQIHCATVQEVLDSVLFAYRLAEHEDVRLPVLVYQDLDYLSCNRETISIPNATTAKQFVGSYNTEPTTLQANTLLHDADSATGSLHYSIFRFEMHLAAQRALTIYDDLVNEFTDFFGRSYPAIDAYRSDDADYVFVMIGSFATRAKEAIDRLRDSGWKVGLLRPRLLQPFPHAKFANLLNGKQAVAVIDQNISMGKGGVLHTQLTTALYGKRGAPAILASFIGGLGGREITTQEFFETASILRKAVLSGETPPPSLLYSEGKLREMNIMRG